MEEQQLHEFCSVTGASRERARFFLEASGWNVQVDSQSEENHLQLLC